LRDASELGSEDWTSAMNRSYGNDLALDLRRRLHDLHFSEELLDSYLNQVAVLAADLTGDETSAGLTIVRDGAQATVAASDERTLALDEIQYSDGDGPCLHSARAGEVVLIPDLETDDRWPDYRDRGLGLGLRSSLSLPLELPDDAAGALNMYVFERHDFDDAEVETLGQFRDEAARALSLALRHDKVTTQRDHLHKALESRRVIDQALGIIMGQNRCSADAAFQILRSASQNRNIKVRDLAAEMIQQVTGNAPIPGAHLRA